MKKILSLATIVLASGFYSSIASAAPETINCPATQVRVQMTTPLSSGWWRTPYVNNLKSTAIITVAGKKTLQCKYGNHGAFSTMRYAPTGKRCRTTSRGFICKSPAPRTHKTGLLNIPQTYTANLDAGRVGGAGADIWFAAETATNRYFAVRNGAKMGIAGRRSVNLQGCKNMNLTNRRIPLASAPVGTYICVKTDQGRYSQFRVNKQAGRSPGTIKIGYTTWKK